MADGLSPREVADIQNTAAKKQAEDAAQIVRDKEKEEQRAIASETMHKMVFDIIELTDFYGDDVIVWVYTDQNTRDLRHNQPVIVMVLWPRPQCAPKFPGTRGGSCRKLGVRFERLVRPLLEEREGLVRHRKDKVAP